MEKVILFGNRAVASVIYTQLSEDEQFDVSAFTVDRAFIKEESLFDLPVIPFDEVQSKYPPDEFKMMIAVGYVKVNKLRAERYYQAKEMGYRMISYISPQASVAKGITVGENCHIAQFCTIAPFSHLGDNVFIGTGSIIGHHSVIKDHCYLAASVRISGYVTVEPYCFFGINAIVRNKVTIARQGIIGAGAVILGDTNEKGVYMSHPAERLPIESDKLSPP